MADEEAEKQRPEVPAAAAPDLPALRLAERIRAKPLPTQIFHTDHRIACVPPELLGNHYQAVTYLKEQLFSKMPKKLHIEIDSVLAGLENVEGVPPEQARTLGYVLTALQGGLSDKHFAMMGGLGTTLQEWRRNAIADFVTPEGALDMRITHVINNFVIVLKTNWSARQKATRSQTDAAAQAFR